MRIFPLVRTPYQQWLKAVDYGIGSRWVGFSHQNFPQYPYRAWHAYGLQPEEAVKIILKLPDIPF